ncbi:MAG: hypothetical protein COB16_01395 [Rhodobacteraceae bacterium]|nr:MAG: hypothetical protein COB16_01395 [Paracoccaceae bacterium]
MKIVSLIQVGNEVEIIDQHIAYHKSLGVDYFVIVDMFSEDGTSEKLDRYRNDPDFVIRRVLKNEVVDDTGIKTPELARWALAVGRDEFDADWIVRMDADEFLFPVNGNLKATLASYGDQKAFKVERRNAIFKSDETDPTLPLQWSDLSQLSIVSDPKAINAQQYQTSDDVPLILTMIQPKTIVRARSVEGFTTGAHDALDAMGHIISPGSADGIISVHFWFTTLSRFTRKAGNTAEFETLMRKHFGRDVGWQWSRWARLTAEGQDAIEREYYRQFPTEQEFQALVQQKKICHVGKYWD